MVGYRIPSYLGRDGVGIVVGEADPLREVQYDMWWRTLLAGPSRSTSGALGNDFPAAYLHDPAGVEHLLYLDAEVDWRSTEAGLRVRDGHWVLGFWSDQPPPAERLIAASRPALSPPARWDGLTRLVDWCLPRLPPPPEPEAVPRYDDIAAAAFAESLREDTALLDIDGLRGHRMYVAGSSEAWDDSKVDHLELLCQSDIALGLAAAGVENDPRRARWLSHLLMVIGRFYAPHLRAFSNVWPLNRTNLAGGNVVVGRHDGRERTNVWYHLYTHARLAELAHLLPNRIEWLPQLRAATDHSLWLAEANRHLFPLFWWLDDGEAVSAAEEPAAGGAFAWLMVRAWDLWGDDRYLRAAGEALEVLHRRSPDAVYGAGVLLPRAAWAADALATRTNDPRWRRYRDDFTAAALRMLYWRGDLAGTFQACAGMRYPALFENVANLLAFDDWLDDSPYPLRQILGLQLRADLPFFEGLPPGAGVPWENLSTVEYPFRSRVGREIYATGEVLRLPYLRARYSGGPTRAPA